MDSKQEPENKSAQRLILALTPLFVLMALLIVNVIFYFDNALSGPNQLALLFSAIIASAMAFKMGRERNYIFKKILHRVKSALGPVLILLMIGAMSGTWMISGIVPLFIKYGIELIHPKIFLFACVVVCSLVSVATGSSWSTVATVGIALSGIGQVMGIHPGLVAGAIISGAYFGDKISPLSDTTNLASAMTGTNLFTHIGYMMYTTIPAMIITLFIFLIIGFKYDYIAVNDNILSLQKAIDTFFNTSPLLLLVPAILIILIIAKVKPYLALLIASVLGGVFALVFQPELVNEIKEVEGSGFTKQMLVLLKTFFTDMKIETPDALLNGLLQSGGMLGMKNTILLIISAMIFSGGMEAAGFLERIAMAVMRFAKSTGSMVATTVVSCIFFNITASDQYLAIVIPGRMYAPMYIKKGLKSEVLSRALEDSGTQTSVLVPWNTCGATQSVVLGTSTLVYMPFCFFNILSPVFSVLWAYLNVRIRKIEK